MGPLHSLWCHSIVCYWFINFPFPPSNLWIGLGYLFMAYPCTHPLLPSKAYLGFFFSGGTRGGGLLFVAHMEVWIFLQFVQFVSHWTQFLWGGACAPSPSPLLAIPLFTMTFWTIDQFGFKSMASAIPGGLPRQTKDDAMPQAYTCSWTKAVHSLKYSSFVMLLEAPQIWRMKRYNVLETELVYSIHKIV